MIRTYQKSDDDAIVEVWFKSFSLAHPFLSSDFMEQEKKNIREIYLPNTATWVYEKNNQLIGFISMMGNEVGAIFLDPHYHKQGIGKEMMDLVANKFDILEVEVFKKNKIGREFYEKYGYRFLKEYIHEATNESMLRLKYEHKN